MPVGHGASGARALVLGAACQVSFSAQSLQSADRHSASDRLSTASDRGRTLFRKPFTPADGLGPDFNAVSCASCHDTPTTGGGGGKDTLVEWTYGDPDDALGGPRQRFGLTSTGATVWVAPMTIERRRPPALFGLGHLEAIQTGDLHLRSDPFDADRDGISGRLPWRDECVGRFGWQSSVCDIQSFVTGALSRELGIETLPRSRRELSESDVRDLVAYVRGLPPLPAGRSRDGGDLFDRVQCSKCHTPVTGVATIAGDRVEVKAYTDLLIHEMGNGPRHGEKDSRTEFRTAPLWALRQRDRPIFTMAPPQRSKKPYSCTAARPNIRGVGSRASVVLKSSNCCGS